MELKINGQRTPLLMPDHYQQVAEDQRIRNGQPVLVQRFGPEPKIVPNHEHLTLIWDTEGGLVSYNLSSGTGTGALPTDDQACEIAVAAFLQVTPVYFEGLNYMRVDHLQRTYQRGGQEISIPISWVKFVHQNGTYNWVSVGPNQLIYELEIESAWDYRKNRRATEMWNYDDWVLARTGKGPQLAAPNALA